jgi:hypothetical protein
MLEDTRRYQKIPEVQYNSQTKKKKTTDNRLPWLTVTGYLCNRLPQICSACRNHNAILRSSVITYHQIFNQINTRGGTSEAGHAYHLGTPQFLVGPSIFGFWLSLWYIQTLFNICFCRHISMKIQDKYKLLA